MADNLSLLFLLKARNQASPVMKQVQTDVSKLTKGVGAEFNALSKVSTQALGSITSSLTNVAGSVPVLGRAVQGLSSEMDTLASAGVKAGSEIAALAGPIGVAIVATAALAAGAAVLVKSLVDVAVQSADTQGKLFDLSQQTGVTVESLSALDLLAKQTGGNIDSLSQSLVVFQGNMEAAEDPTSKQAKLFDELNVTITDTEETLRATLAALARMPVGFEQTNRAAELFGRRGGKQFLAILKEAHGDIDKTVRELQGLGLASSENAKRADELNDQLVRLQAQLTGLQVTIGNQVIPALLDALKELDRFLKDNKESIEALAFAARFTAESLSGQLRLALLLVTPQLKAQEGVVRLLADAYEALAAAAQLASGKLPQVNANAIPAQPLSSPESGQKLLDTLDKLRVQQEQAAKFGLKPFDLEEIFGLKKTKAGGLDPAVQLFKQLQNELRTLEGATKAETVAAELLDTKYKDISATLKEQILIVAQLIDRKREQTEADEKEREELEKQKRAREEALNAIFQFTRAQADELDRLRGVTRSAADEADIFIRTTSLLAGALDNTTAAWIRFNANLIDSARHLRELNQLLKDVAENTPGIAPEGIGTPGPFTGGIFDEIPPEAEERFKGLDSALQDLGESLGNLVGASENFKTDFADVIGQGIGDLAFAVGDLVHQWVLLGETGPNAMRKLTASVLAGLAAQAAVKAVFQLAEGFAALFFNPAEAAAHFQSAALFGSIAGVAAVAGRSVAGDLFKDKGASGGGAGAGSNNGQLNPLTLNRNQPQPTRVIVEVRTNDSVFGKAISAHIVKDIQEAGPIRETIANDGRY